MSWWWLPASGWDASARKWRDERSAPKRRPNSSRRHARNAKLTLADVAEIRRAGREETHAMLAARYGVSKSLIRRVRKEGRECES